MKNRIISIVPALAIAVSACGPSNSGSDFVSVADATQIVAGHLSNYTIDDSLISGRFNDGVYTGDVSVLLTQSGDNYDSQSIESLDKTLGFNISNMTSSEFESLVDNTFSGYEFEPVLDVTDSLDEDFEGSDSISVEVHFVPSGSTLTAVINGNDIPMVNTTGNTYEVSKSLGYTNGVDTWDYSLADDGAVSGTVGITGSTESASLGDVTKFANEATFDYNAPLFMAGVSGDYPFVWNNNITNFNGNPYEYDINANNNSFANYVTEYVGESDIESDVDYKLQLYETDGANTKKILPATLEDITSELNDFYN